MAIEHCPAYCSALIEAEGGEEGDLVVCPCCAAVSVVTSERTLALATDDLLASLDELSRARLAREVARVTSAATSRR
jgi:hypothetical protein